MIKFLVVFVIFFVFAIALAWILTYLELRNRKIQEQYKKNRKVYSEDEDIEERVKLPKD